MYNSNACYCFALRATARPVSRISITKSLLFFKRMYTSFILVLCCCWLCSNKGWAQPTSSPDNAENSTGFSDPYSAITPDDLQGPSLNRTTTGNPSSGPVQSTPEPSASPEKAENSTSRFSESGPTSTLDYLQGQSLNGTTTGHPSSSPAQSTPEPSASLEKAENSTSRFSESGPASTLDYLQGQSLNRTTTRNPFSGSQQSTPEPDVRENAECKNRSIVVQSSRISSTVDIGFNASRLTLVVSQTGEEILRNCSIGKNLVSCQNFGKYRIECSHEVDGSSTGKAVSCRSLTISVEEVEPKLEGGLDLKVKLSDPPGGGYVLKHAVCPFTYYEPIAKKQCSVELDESGKNFTILCEICGVIPHRDCLLKQHPQVKFQAGPDPCTFCEGRYISTGPSSDDCKGPSSGTTSGITWPKYRQAFIGRLPVKDLGKADIAVRFVSLENSSIFDEIFLKFGLPRVEIDRKCFRKSTFITAPDGKGVIMYCRCTAIGGNPMGYAQWYIDGRPATTADKQNVFSTLPIRLRNLDDDLTGSHVCKGENRLASTFPLIYNHTSGFETVKQLYVLGKPDPPLLAINTTSGCSTRILVGPLEFCTCRLTYPGYPASVGVEWREGNNYVYQHKQGETSVLVAYIEQNERQKTYSCHATYPSTTPTVVRQVHVHVNYTVRQGTSPLLEAARRTATHCIVICFLVLLLIASYSAGAAYYGKYALQDSEEDCVTIESTESNRSLDSQPVSESFRARHGKTTKRRQKSKEFGLTLPTKRQDPTSSEASSVQSADPADQGSTSGLTDRDPTPTWAAGGGSLPILDPRNRGPTSGPADPRSNIDWNLSLSLPEPHPDDE